MANIVDRLGRLHRRTGINIDQDSEYEILELPILRYTNNPDARIQLTEDGKLFDIHTLKLLEIEGDHSFKKVISHSTTHRIKYDTDIQQVYFYAHEENGDVFTGRIRNNELMEWKIMRSNVELMGHGIHLSGLIIVEKGKIKSIGDGNYDVDIANSNNEQVVDIRPGVVVLTDSLIVQGNGAIPTITIPLNGGELLGTGTITRSVGKYACNTYGDIIVYKKNEKLVILFRREDHIEYEEVCNRFLTDMYQLSPWTEVVTIDENPHLVNTNGMIVRLVEEGGIVSTNIPIGILDSSTRMKNPMTRIN